MQGLTADHALHPRVSRVLAVLVALVAAVPLVGLTATGRFDLLVRAAAPLALLLLADWAVFWRPEVVVGPAELVFVNPLRTVRLTWPAIDEVQTRWSLTVVTARGPFTAWAAPRPSRIGGAVSVRRDAYGRPDYAAQSRYERESPRATGDVAALVVQRQWETYRDRGLLGAVEGRGVQTTWHLGTLIAAAVLVVCWVLALQLG